MTDTAVEQENTEATEDQEPETPTFPDEISELSFKQLANLIGERNQQVARINAVKGDRLSLLKDLEENSTNPDAVKAREARDKAQAALDEAVMLLHKAVQPEIESLTSDAEKSVSSIEDAVKEYDAKIKPGMNYFKKMYGEHLAKFLPGLDRLKGFSTKGAGSSGRRIRGYNVVVTEENGEVTEFPNVASAAKYLEVDTADIQSKFFEAAGNPENLKDAPNRVDFKVEYVETDEDGKSETLTASIVCEREVKDESTAADESDAE